ncbi:MAG TPA: GNAT family N-acetyltransferase [Jiangellaceae bacterium]|nr:GNAT family N-acetyltransferase [Jiangellaceae bacterium]
MTVSVVPMTPDRWEELAEFFGPNGANSNCWCAWFRVRAKHFDNGPGNRRVLRRLTLEGAVPGLLAYDGPRPVGWVSVAPRQQFERILRSRVIGPVDPDEPGIWSLVCFWIPMRRRGAGIGTALLSGAVDHARAHDAAVVEAYPVETAGERRPSAEIFTGTVAMFRKAGFTIAAHPGSGRPIARLRLSGRRTAADDE